MKQVEAANFCCGLRGTKQRSACGLLVTTLVQTWSPAPSRLLGKLLSSFPPGLLLHMWFCHSSGVFSRAKILGGPNPLGSLLINLHCFPYEALCPWLRYWQLSHDGDRGMASLGLPGPCMSFLGIAEDCFLCPWHPHAFLLFPTLQPHKNKNPPFTLNTFLSGKLTFHQGWLDKVTFS